MMIFDRYKNSKPIFDSFEKLGRVTTGEEYIENDPFVTEAPHKTPPLATATWVFRGLVGLCLVIFVIRLLFLQINQGNQNLSLAKGNSLRLSYQIAPRGIIFDRNGIPLVQNTVSYSLVIYPSELPSKKDERDKTIQQIASVIEQDFPDLSDKIATLAKKQQTITLLDNIPREQAIILKLRLSDLNSVEIQAEPQRHYHEIAGIGNVLGYVGRVTEDNLKNNPNLLNNDLIGKTGIEMIYDDQLRGTTGISTIEVDSTGRLIREVNNQPAKIGQSIYLTIDSHLQQASADFLRESLEKNQAKSGSAIMSDVRTGEILAMVSIPYYNPNDLLPNADPQKRRELLSDPNAPMINRVISGQYPSGSVIKPIIAAAALQEGIITKDTKLDTSEGKITIGEWNFPDWKTHGVTNVAQAIADSNNIFFYALGGGYKNINGLGIDRIEKYLGLFGLSENLGIDLPGEFKGFVPTPSWKKSVKKESWYIGDTYHVSIGQGDLLTSPLKINSATATIANGGNVLRPHVVDQIISGSKAQPIETKVIRDSFINQEHLNTVRSGMRLLVEKGLSQMFSNFTVNIAAKTGTAQFDVAKDKTHAWFTAFGPYENPEVAVTVLVEGGGQGYVAAAPVARNMLAKYFNQPLIDIQPATNPSEN